MSTSVVFNNIFDAISREIEFNPNWVNEYGYFEYSVNGKHAVTLEPGEYAKSIDKDGRKIVFLSTEFGAVAVYRLFANRMESIYTYSAAKSLTEASFLPIGTLDEDKINFILGDPMFLFSRNIHTIIKNVVKMYSQKHLVPLFKEMESQLDELRTTQQH
jgi:hypothetical protein